MSRRVWFGKNLGRCKNNCKNNCLTFRKSKEQSLNFFSNLSFLMTQIFMTQKDGVAAPPETELLPLRTLPPPAAASRQSPRPILGLAACGMLTAGIILGIFLRGSAHAPMFLFCTVLALLATGLPATGPRGQRVGLLPAVGLAGILLLPLGLALLPLLLASAAFAFSRETPLARRLAQERGVCLLLAALAGGLMPHLVTETLPKTLLTAGAYSAVFLIGRRLCLRRHQGAERTVRRHALQNWKLEAATLCAAAPAVLLMALAFPRFGMAGLSGAAALLALVVVVAHFGFEVAGLREQVRAMEKISAITVSQTSAPRVADLFLQLSTSLVSCDRASLWLTDESDTRLECTANPKESGASRAVSLRFGEGLAGRAAARKKPVIVRDGTQDPRLAAEERRPSASSFAMLLLPLVAGNQVMGVAQLERDAPGAFSRRDLLRLQALASQAAATLANVRAHQDVYSQAVTDALTGLFNRRHMQTVLADERRRAQRYGHPLSVIMLDVDGFKSYNDTYGHVQGDVLLKMMADILQGQVRGVDRVGRFGGEEFLVVLPETPSEEAFQTAERLRQAVARTLFPGFAADPDLVVFKTISLGVATYPDITDDTQALVTLADNALYRAKRGGRNQTIQASPETQLLERE